MTWHACPQCSHDAPRYRATRSRKFWRTYRILPRRVPRRQTVKCTSHDGKWVPLELVGVHLWFFRVARCTYTCIAVAVAVSELCVHQWQRLQPRVHHLNSTYHKRLFRFWVRSLACACRPHGLRRDTKPEQHIFFRSAFFAHTQTRIIRYT